MKKIIITFLVVGLVQTGFAVGPAPAYLKGGTITVILKDGTTYNFSTDEYAVVKRGSEAKLAEKVTETASAPSAQKSEPHRNVISFGVVRSTRGFNLSEGPSSIEVTSKKEIGVQLQYQRRVSGTFYLGGQVDTNQGVGLSIGLGFD